MVNLHCPKPVGVVKSIIDADLAMVASMFRILSIILFLLGGLEAAVAASPGQPVRLAFEPVANPPRYYGEGTAIDWSRPGLTLELLKLVEKHLDITFSYQRMPWNRALYLLETNDLDGVFHASFVPERTKLGVYPMVNNQPNPTRAIFTQSYAFYRLRGSTFGWDGHTVSGADRPVGVTIGYSVANDLKKLGLTVEEDRGKEANFNKLLNGRISAFADLEHMTDLFIHRNPERFGAVEKINNPIIFKHYYLILSHGFYKSNPSLAENIWDAIHAIKESDAFVALLEKYID